MTSPLSRRMLAAALLLGMILLHGQVDSAAAQQAVVHGVLIYDPTCGSCEVVLDEVLPPLEARYGDQLDIVRIDASTAEGFDIWSAGTKAYQVPDEKKGVPQMFLGSQALSGSAEISDHLADAIEAGLAAGGVPFPTFVTLTENDRARWAAHSASPVAAAPKVDPVAYGLAFVVLFVTLVGLVFAAFGLWQSRPLAVRSLSERAQLERAPVIVPLIAAGLIVAGYLSYLHLSTSSAICPVGDCDAVQHSAYANLLGVPVAYLGFLSYAALLGLWLWSRTRSGDLARLASVLFVGLAAFGTAFSAYLTTLELFVIHAVCMWCLMSAVLMTVILVVAACPLAHADDAPSLCRTRREASAPSAVAGGS